MHKKSTSKTAVAISIALGVCSPIVIADDVADTMRVGADDGTDKHLDDQASAARATPTPSGFEDDMRRLSAAAGMSNVTTTTSANGMHSTVLPLSKMKMLVVRKNTDGTFTVGHVSDTESAEKFLSADSSATTTREE